MNTVTQNVSNYVKSKEINFLTLSQTTGISYNALITSLGDNQHSRELRADEFLEICKFLGVSPLEFTNKEKRPPRSLAN